MLRLSTLEVTLRLPHGRISLRAAPLHHEREVCVAGKGRTLSWGRAPRVAFPKYLSWAATSSTGCCLYCVVCTARGEADMCLPFGQVDGHVS